MIQGVEILRRKLSQRAGEPFAKILNEKVIEEAIVQAQFKYRNRLFTPIITIWAFLYQVLDPDKSWANAVKQIRSCEGFGRSRETLPEYWWLC